MLLDNGRFLIITDKFICKDNSHLILGSDEKDSIFTKVSFNINNITTNRDEGYYIPIMIINNGSFKTVKLNSSNISLSLPKYTELEVDLSVDTISTVMSAINSSLNSNFGLMHDKISNSDSKLNSLTSINEEIVQIKNLKKKFESTKIS